MLCSACPRKCNAFRGLHKNEGKGFCKTGRIPVVSRAAPHFGEEPCISGTRGSGTVFFSGCNLGCVYCQNHEISRGLLGKEVSVEELRKIYFSLIQQGVHNIELVTPCHFREAVSQSLNEKLPVPVICNTGGYDSVETVELFHNKIDVYMPDYKYSESEVAKKYSDWKGNATIGIYATKGEKVKLLEDAALKLKEGEYSRVLAFDEGHAILMRLPMDQSYINSNFDDFIYQSATRRYNELMEEIAAELEVEYTDYYYTLTMDALTSNKGYIITE